jgi:hypothetical protein
MGYLKTYGKIIQYKQLIQKTQRLILLFINQISLFLLLKSITQINTIVSHLKYPIIIKKKILMTYPR